MTGPVVLAWYACDLQTGVISEELRSLSPSGTVGRRLGQSTTAQFDLVLEGAPATWDDATIPGHSMLVGVDIATTPPTPVWAGIILTRAGGSADSVQLGAATPEAYIDRRYPGTYTATGADQATIMTGLGAPLLVNGANFAFDAPATGTTASYSIDDGDDRSILSVWTELMGAAGGAEWTIDPVWQDAAMSTIQLVIRIRAKVGTQNDMPDVVLDMLGNISSYTLTESYEAGHGATAVIARGDGQGDTRATSSLHVDADLLAAGWPDWEYRFTPADGVDDDSVLDEHADEALAQMATGSSVWTVTAVASQAPRVGSDLGLGDSIRLEITTSPRHPDGAEVVARCYGWDLDPAGNTLTPILIEGD